MSENPPLHPRARTDASDTGPIAFPSSATDWSAADTGPLPASGQRPGDRDTGGDPATAPYPAASPPGSALSDPRAERRYQGSSRAPLRPAAPGIPPVPRRPSRPGGRFARTPEAVTFMLHQFPIGYLPVAEGTPSRQLPLDVESGGPATPPRRCGTVPAEHPNAALVNDAASLPPPSIHAGEWSGPADDSIPAELLTGYDPSGGASDAEWERIYLRRTGYAWPDRAAELGSAEVLPTGTEVDVLGDTSRREVFAVGTPFARRSQPPAYRHLAYRQFRVRRPVPVWRTVVIPWFEQPGGGTRYRLTHPIVELIALGYLAATLMNGN